MTASPCEIVILAAGRGTRMHSATAKVLHLLGGTPLLGHVIASAERLKPRRIHIVYGYQGEQCKSAFTERSAQLDLHWVEQTEPRGTGHALQQVLPHIAKDSHVIVLNGDVPLISVATLQRLRAAAEDAALTLLTAQYADPTGLGRICRDKDGAVTAIVEEKDASAAVRDIKEAYTGVCVLKGDVLADWCARLTADNAQQEYYLTQVADFAVADKVSINTVETTQLEEVQGVNDRYQLAQLERFYQQQMAMQLCLTGVTIADLDRLDIRGDVTVGADTFIDINCVLEGKITIGKNCHIGPGCQLRNVTIGEGSRIHAHSVLADCEIGDDCDVGPFARIRPQTILATGAKVGNFVEVKKSTIGPQSKVSHLAYIGDTTIGKAVNIGAGTVTCNYDGYRKSLTVIEDGAFIGSGSLLVAPVTIGRGAMIGANSTITRDAPAEELTLARSPQQTVYGWMAKKQ